MGAGNVKEAFVRWAHLPHAPFRLLVFMCVTSSDVDEPRFWAGQEVMAMACGLPVDTTKERQSSFRTVRRHIEVLCEAKVIERTRAGHAGQNAEYTLRLSMGRRTLTALQSVDNGGHPEPSNVDEDGGHPQPSKRRERRAPSVQNGGRSTPHWRAPSSTLEGTQCPPEEEQDHKRTRENEVVTAAGSAPARAPRRARVHTREGRCADCGTDHSGYTCAEYRDGADLQPQTKPRSRRNRGTSDPT